MCLCSCRSQSWEIMLYKMRNELLPHTIQSVRMLSVLKQIKMSQGLWLTFGLTDSLCPLAAHSWDGPFCQGPSILYPPLVSPPTGSMLVLSHEVQGEGLRAGNFPNRKNHREDSEVWLQIPFIIVPEERKALKNEHMVFSSEFLFKEVEGWGWGQLCHWERS